MTDGLRLGTLRAEAFVEGRLTRNRRGRRPDDRTGGWVILGWAVVGRVVDELGQRIPRLSVTGHQPNVVVNSKESVGLALVLFWRSYLQYQEPYS